MIKKRDVKKVQSTSSKKYYYVQVGSFKRKPSNTYMRKIHVLGLPTKVKKTNIYKVLVGPYRKESTARNVLGKIKKKLNKSAFITKQ